MTERGRRLREGPSRPNSSQPPFAPSTSPSLITMVKIEEVDDSASWVEDDSSSSVSDSDSILSDAGPDSFDPSAESLSDRFLALKDIIPPSTRLTLSESYAATKSWVQWTGKTVGKSAWVLTTTALLVGLPLALSIEGEGALVAQEKEYMGQQGMAPAAAAGAAPASGVVPPGF